MSSEADFLKTYNIHDFEVPLTSVDSVLLTVHEEALKVLLVERAEHPAQGRWALPGGFIDLERDTSLDDCALRKLQDKTGVKPPYIEQLITVGNAKRDPRGWSVTVVFYALVAHQDCHKHVSSVSDTRWVSVTELAKLKLAFDHAALIRAAIERLRQKALYSIVPAYALPREFTLGELQHLHEIILGQPLQKKSFRRRIEKAELLIDTGRERSHHGRPARLYRARKETRDFTFNRNLEG